MRPKPKDEIEDTGPPKPAWIFLISLFGYPGVGHFMLGHKKAGWAFVLGFTGLTLGVIFEIVAIGGPLLRLMTEGTPMESPPNWARIGFWVLATTVVWAGSGIHSYLLAKKMNTGI